MTLENRRLWEKIWELERQVKELQLRQRPLDAFGRPSPQRDFLPDNLPTFQEPNTKVVC